ncbi:hypothetical protein AAFN75_06260 [Algibacter sp. AS12]|uniref:hypothetical protein n=1 Tax=Algibacter sp. AS12 TaxID=3135773 RepID=UPI00398AAE61
MCAKNNFVLFLLLALLLACKQPEVDTKVKRPVNIDDTNYVLDKNYKKGDVRRYGVYPNEKISNKNLQNIISLSSKGLPMVFPKGDYATNLVLDSISILNFTFNNATITGGVNIVNNSFNIKLGGNLTILERLFVKGSSDIVFDTLTVKTDTLKCLTTKKNRGVSLYAGAKNISFQLLNIENTGGTKDKFYQHTAAALQVHGWKNNPENVFIKNLTIKNVDRTGLYLTGNGHRIEKVTINNFGQGSSENMFALGDAFKGEEKEFSGAWLNRCNNCEIDTLIVNATNNKGNYSVILDEGKYYEPTFIYNIHFKNKAKALPIKDDKLTNILVKNEF